VAERLRWCGWNDLDVGKLTTRLASPAWAGNLTAPLRSGGGAFFLRRWHTDKIEPSALYFTLHPVIQIADRVLAIRHPSRSSTANLMLNPYCGPGTRRPGSWWGSRDSWSPIAAPIPLAQRLAFPASDNRPFFSHWVARSKTHSQPAMYSAAQRCQGTNLDFIWFVNPVYLFADRLFVPEKLVLASVHE